MKKCLIFLLLTVPFAPLFAQTDSLETYLIQGNMFKVKQILDKNAGTIDKSTQLYYKCFVDNAFGKYDSSILETALFLKSYSRLFSDTAIARIMIMNVFNYANTYQYKKAADAGDAVIKKYAALLATAQLDDITDVNKMFHSLTTTPPQIVAAHDDITIPIKKDKAGLWRLPVTIKNCTNDFIFDTHANFSVVSVSGALKMGLKRLVSAVDLKSGATGIVNNTTLAIADSIIIGDRLKIQNVVFLVMPDSLLRAGDYDISCVLGLPVIKALKEVQLSKNGTLRIPARPTNCPLRNLLINEFSPRILIATKDNDSLILEFDTGADSTDLFSTYFDRYKKNVLQNGVLKTIGQGGAGGIKNVEFYALENFSFKVASKNVMLKRVYVRTLPSPDMESYELIYGNMGEDVISQFETMTINFDDMYVDFK